MVKPIITPYQLSTYNSELSELYSFLETEIFIMIANRLKEPKGYDKDYVLQWQIEKLAEVRAFNADTIRLLSDYTGLEVAAINKMISDVGFEAAKEIDELVGDRSLDEPTDLDNLFAGLARQANDNYENLVRGALIGGALSNTSATGMYQTIVNQTVASVLAGNRTINQAVTDILIRQSKNGIKSKFIDKAGRRWSNQAYTELLVRNTVNNSYNEARMARMQDYGIDNVRVSSHASPRPYCAPIQGKIANVNTPSTDPRYPSISNFGYGLPEGLRGINCKHILYPYIPGLNTNNEYQFNEEQAKREYEKTQRQRYLERRIKESKRALELSEITGDQQAIDKYKEQVKARQQVIREYTQREGLPRQYARERVIRGQQ